jgi:hypothetical protein
MPFILLNCPPKNTLFPMVKMLLTLGALGAGLVNSGYQLFANPVVVDIEPQTLLEVPPKVLKFPAIYALPPSETAKHVTPPLMVDEKAVGSKVAVSKIAKFGRDCPPMVVKFPPKNSWFLTNETMLTLLL